MCEQNIFTLGCQTRNIEYRMLQPDNGDFQWKTESTQPKSQECTFFRDLQQQSNFSKLYLMLELNFCLPSPKASYISFP